MRRLIEAKRKGSTGPSILFRILLSGSLGLLIILTAGCGRTTRVPQPNILFIVIDDLRPAMGCYGDTLAITPNIDALAGKGIRFNHAYCQQAVCNPSRTSFMTGKRPDHIRVWDNRVHFRTSFPEVLTMPQYLKEQGYQTQAIGKIYHDPAWAQDSLSWSEPALHVVTTFEGKYDTEENLSMNKRKANAWEIADDPGESYVDIRVCNAAIKFLETQRRKPFFLAVGFRRPHLPFSAPREFWEMHDAERCYPVPNGKAPENVPGIVYPEFNELRGYANIPEAGELPAEMIRTLRHGYYASVSYIDHLTGLVLDALERQGLDENTVIVFTADHGYHIGEHEWWCKTTNFELDTRVPLIISHPKMKAGGMSDALVELVDLYPSLMEICGLGIPDDLDGKSMAHLLDDPGAVHKPFALSQFPRPWFYQGAPEIMGYSIRTKDMRYTEWQDWNTGELIAMELYDHRIDPDETINLADRDQYAEERRSLRETLQSALE